MYGAEQEHLTSIGGHFIVSYPSNTSRGAVPSNSFFDHTNVTTPLAPPFAPQPDVSQQHGDTATSITRSTATPPVSSSEFNIHEFCYYFQQVIFISAIMTGGALIIAGAVMHAQNGELLVFVYIGVLLIGVNSVLLTIQCYVRQKQNKRARVSSTGRRPQENTAVHYNALDTNPLVSAPVSYSQPTGIAPSGISGYLHQHRMYSDAQHHMYGDCRRMHQYGAKTSLEVGQHGHCMLPLQTSQVPPVVGSLLSYTCYPKENYINSQPLNQHPSHQPIVTPQSSQLPTPRSEHMPVSYTSSGPPSYNDLLASGRLPPDGTTVHII
ncbi:uncharacterized protein LOC111088329 [Limulus polyphemus]|uniref:Uncharacterized protein LOC111088329 n=1 Tax=Limulus polyphemus TaxID=6850 RepID=A0ABM1TD81_LIMPO|nr:uncharacterized protein LOC111088329 [Limulus polyphemus]